MHLENLNMDKTPESGCLLAYTREKVLFETYKTKEEAKHLLDGKELLEVHFYDEKKEYRVIESKSSRFPSGMIEAVVENKPETEYFTEDILLENGSIIRVYNELVFDELGMASVANYRLAILGEEEK